MLVVFGGVLDFGDKMLTIVDSAGNYYEVDKKDFEQFNQFLWSPANGGYAHRHVKEGTLYLHVEIAKAAGIFVNGHEVDHKDRNRSNCKRSNLRAATQQQTRINSSKNETPSGIKYKGVRETKYGRFVAYYVRERRHIYLRTFDTQEEAARYRDRIVKRIFGEFAVLNFSEDS